MVVARLLLLLLLNPTTCRPSGIGSVLTYTSQLSAIAAAAAVQGTSISIALKDEIRAELHDGASTSLSVARHRRRLLFT